MTLGPLCAGASVSAQYDAVYRDECIGSALLDGSPVTSVPPSIPRWLWLAIASVHCPQCFAVNDRELAQR